MQKSAEKSQKLKEANKQQNFNTGIKDFDFWLSEVTPRGSPFLSLEEVGLFEIVDQSASEKTRTSQGALDAAYSRHLHNQRGVVYCVRFISGSQEG